MIVTVLWACHPTVRGRKDRDSNEPAGEEQVEEYSELAELSGTVASKKE